MDLGHIHLLDTSSQDDIGTILGSPINLDFTCQMQKRGGEFFDTDICASTKYVDVGPVFAGTDGSHYDEIDLVSCPQYLVGSTPTCTQSFDNLSSPYVDGPQRPGVPGRESDGFHV